MSGTEAPSGQLRVLGGMKLKMPLDEIRDSALDFDARTQKLFKPYAETAAVAALHPISKLGDQPQLRTIAGALVLAGLIARSHRLVNAGARMIVAHEAATFVKDMLKTEVDRTRPRSADSRHEKKPKKGKHTSKEMTSFPSGHSAGSIAAARAFAREFPEYAAAAIGAGATIALLQIPRCAHYPSDVAAGLAVGLASEAVTNGLWDLAGADGDGGAEA